MNPPGSAGIVSISGDTAKSPMEETLASLPAEDPTDEQIADLAEDMQTLVAVVMLATGVADDATGTAYTLQPTASPSCKDSFLVVR